MEIPGLRTGSRDKDFRLLTFITWMTLIVGPIAYLVLVYFLSQETGTLPAPPPTAFFYILLGIALIDILALIPLIQKLMLAAPVRLQGAMKYSNSPVVSLLTIRLALLSSTYIFGLVTFFMSREITFLPYFYAIGILGSLLYWPTRERFDAIADQLEAK